MTSTNSSSSHPPAPPAAADDGSTERRQPTTSATSAAQLASAKVELKATLRQFKDFPAPGILFEDICPIFRNPKTHAQLVDALTLFVDPANDGPGLPDIVVGLDARGFLFAPSLALRLGAGFVPVRKPGKLPGQNIRAGYTKEYGEDFFEMQEDAIKPGEKVLVVDDIIATGGSAAAAGQLVRKLGGTLLGYVFILELGFLKGRDKLDAPVFTLLSGQEGED